MFSPPPRLQFPISPSRAPSPTMSPGGRRGRSTVISEEGHLRDLSPDTTLRAFTQRPMPYDTSRDQYKIFGCIESLTPAERDLGARVAKAAQRLKAWCAEIEQWGWSGSFEPPSEERREQRRKSLELRIREHVKGVGAIEGIGSLEYWGSLLSVEVEAHEGRLDEIGDELLALDIEELKEHVLDIHGPNRSRPSSAGLERTRHNYTPMDDFSFLITQTLLAALPNHFQLKVRLSTWTARVCVLRDAPRYLADLKTAEKAMKLGWDAVEPPADHSDISFERWKEALETISGVLQDKVSHLGQRLDRMLDALEGQEDRLPDDWIDVFEGVETDFGRWAHDSRKRVMEFDMRRKADQHNAEAVGSGDTSERLITHADLGGTLTPENHETPSTPNEQISSIVDNKEAEAVAKASVKHLDLDIIRTAKNIDGQKGARGVNGWNPRSIASRSPTAFKSSISEGPSWRLDSTDAIRPTDAVVLPKILAQKSEPAIESKAKPTYFGPQVLATTGAEAGYQTSAPAINGEQQVLSSHLDVPLVTGVEVLSWQPELAADENSCDLRSNSEDALEDDSIFEEGDTVLHTEVEEPLSPTLDFVPVLPERDSFSDSSVIVTVANRPQTPQSRRSSVDSIASDILFSSSPPAIMDESPSVRNTTNRPAKAPRPALNAAMSKRRAPKKPKDLSVGDAPPWPPTQFTKPSVNSAEDLERKISDILTTIPAHIRLTSGIGPNAREVKPGRGITSKGSRGYLRPARSMNGLKSPELTLSPVRSDLDSNAASGRKSVAAMRGDNDIKLYHLTQPGKEHPIKLFIRRVGENGERVMVRVGGGWADLGEYLRQYAEHHGRRAVSDSKFEILGLEIPEMSPGRPESAMGRRDRCFSGGGPHNGSPNTTPQKSPGMGILKDDTAAPVPSIATPGIVGDASAPSPASSRVSWSGNEVGLAGPKAKKLDLSGEKLEWIEGMMKQARTVSGTLTSAPRVEHVSTHPERAESRSESRTGARKADFGDLGKVGGTKRLFLRGGALSEH